MSTQVSFLDAVNVEVRLLGSMILYRDCVEEILPIVRRDSFYRHDHQMIFGALVKLHEAEEPIDLITLRDELFVRGQLHKVGGVDYLVRLAEGVPSGIDAVCYAEFIRDKGRLSNQEE